MIRFERFSKKQLQVLGWWMDGSPERGRDGILCDGAVRSGKTLCMTLSYVGWAMYRFDGQAFAICGKTIASLRRNILQPMLPALSSLGFACRWRPSGNFLDVAFAGRSNRFWLFGGRDEGSSAMIQGVTLAGVFLDEAALMPRSFVEQALARCSVPGSKFWFDCNPEHPFHWFYREWIRKAEEKNCRYLHFTMADNPSLTPEIVARYQKLYSGAFYDRFVLGKWTAPQGLVYPRFSPELHVRREPEPKDAVWYVSVDYGTANPCSMGLWGSLPGERWHRFAEYYHDSRACGEQRTDEEYYAALEALAGGRTVAAVIVDPSAASFLECVRRHGRFRVIPAENAVAEGVAKVSEWLQEGRLTFSPDCRDSIREFGLYRWRQDCPEDRPVKENDHAMDDIRYFVSTLGEDPRGGFFAASVPRAPSRAIPIRKEEPQEK